MKVPCKCKVPNIILGEQGKEDRGFKIERVLDLELQDLKKTKGMSQSHQCS